MDRVVGCHRRGCARDRTTGPGRARRGRPRPELRGLDLREPGRRDRVLRALRAGRARGARGSDLADRRGVRRVRGRVRARGGTERLPPPGGGARRQRVVRPAGMATARRRGRDDRGGARPVGDAAVRRGRGRAERPVHRDRAVPDARRRAPARRRLRREPARGGRAPGPRLGAGERLDRVPVRRDPGPDRGGRPELGRRAQHAARARRRVRFRRSRGVRVARHPGRTSDAPTCSGTTMARRVGGDARRVRTRRAPRRRADPAPVPVRRRGGRRPGRGAGSRDDRAGGRPDACGAVAVLAAATARVAGSRGAAPWRCSPRRPRSRR